MSSITKAFGISQEGSTIKAAVLSLDKGILRIEDLQTASATGVHTSVVEAPLEEVLESLDFDLEFGDTTETSSYEEDDSKPYKETPLADDQIYSEALSDTRQQKTLSELAEELSFESGTLSLNLDFSNVTYKELKLPPKIGKKKIFTEMRKHFYENGGPSVSTLAYFQRSDSSYIGISHERNMELLEQVITINRAISRKRYHYSYVQPNEIALLNALRLNYSLTDDEVSALIYISQDHTQVLLTKGYDFLVDLPLINEGYQSKDIIKTTISRIMLERTHIGVSAIQNYFIAGQGLSDSMLSSINERDPNAKAQYLLPVKICEQSDCSHLFEDAKLAEFIVPIMLSVVSLIPKEHSLLRTNFLPKQLIEQQNILSINTSGFFVLGTILIAGLVSINLIFSLQTANSSLKLENTNLSYQISVQQTLLDSVFVITKQIEDIEKNIARTKQLIGDKNQWHFVLEKISETFQANPLVWITSLRNERDGFRISGKTNNRLNLIQISELLPESIIYSITEDEIEGNRVWQFEITFKNPDALETKRLNYQREQQNVPKR